MVVSTVTYTGGHFIPFEQRTEYLVHRSVTAMRATVLLAFAGAAVGGIIKRDVVWVDCGRI